MRSKGRPAAAAALSFNPGGDTATEELVKVAHAACMQALIDPARYVRRVVAEDATIEQRAAHSDRLRCIATALTDLEKAQLMATRALHTAANAGA